MQNVEEFLGLLRSVKPTGQNQWMALCPGHRDTKPSLSVKEADSKILLQCFAGCELTDILKPLELEPRDLFLNSHKAKVEHREIEAIFYYIDANGKPFEVVRTRPKGFYQRRPNGKGGYINNLRGIVPTLYRQDEVKRAIVKGEAIYFVEGEKDVERLRDLGLTATTSPMGAGKWRDRYCEALRGANLITIPDNDEPGCDHANHMAKSCFSVAKIIHMLELPGDCSDVSDWLDKGGDRNQLERLVSDCPVYEADSDNERVRLRCMADVQPEKVDWLWYPYIPKGKITLLEGDPGVGKSWVCLAIATAVSLDHGLPGAESTTSAKVLLASAEDGLGDTIRPRLNAMGADVANIFAIDGALTLDENGFDLLEGYLERVRPELSIIDPLVAYLGGSIDIHRANETRAVMSQLARLAEKYDTAILAIRHLTKGGMPKPIYRGLGSIDFTAACRSVLLAGCDTENPQNRGLVQIKSNLAPMGDAIGFELSDSNFYWTGECGLTAERILAIEDTERTSALSEAINFLKEELADGPVEANQVFRDAKAAGIEAKITLRRAKDRLGLNIRRQGEAGKRGGGCWIWELPEDLDAQTDNSGQSQKDLDAQDAHIKENEHLNNSSLKNASPGLDDDTLNPEAQAADLGDTPPYPTHPCPACGCGERWLRQAGSWGPAEWLCSRCHPESAKAN